MTRLTVGETAPRIRLADTDGQIVEVDPSRYAATILVFTSGGCPYALAWHDRLQHVGRDYSDKGVQLVQVVSNDATTRPEDAPEAMAERVARAEIVGPYLHDVDQCLASAFGATATPEVFVLDPGGAVRYHGAPDGSYDDPTANAAWLRDALDDLLAGREVARPTTSPAGCSIKWRVELRWWEGCPSHADAVHLLEATLDDIRRGDVTILEREVSRRSEAAELSFPGSPTFVVGGLDLFPTTAPAALGCRAYPQSDGRIGPLPDLTELAAALRDATVRPWELPGWVDFRKVS